MIQELGVPALSCILTLGWSPVRMCCIHLAAQCSGLQASWCSTNSLVMSAGLHPLPHQLDLAFSQGPSTEAVADHRLLISTILPTHGLQQLADPPQTAASSQEAHSMGPGCADPVSRPPAAPLAGGSGLPGSVSMAEASHSLLQTPLDLNVYLQGLAAPGLPAEHGLQTGGADQPAQLQGHVGQGASQASLSAAGFQLLPLHQPHMPLEPPDQT